MESESEYETESEPEIERDEERFQKAAMAAASLPLSAEAQKELLLSMGLPFESWRADVPLGDFEGVTVGNDGLIVSLDFRREVYFVVAFKLGDFAPLVSLRELNMQECRRATGECVVGEGFVYVYHSEGRVRGRGEGGRKNEEGRKGQ